MQPLGERLLAEKQKPDREQPGARVHENKYENQDVTEVLFLGAGVEFFWRRCYDGQPGEDEHSNSEGIPGNDAPGGGLKLAGEEEPDCGRKEKCEPRPMSRVQFGNPVHVAMQLSRNAPQRSTLNRRCRGLDGRTARCVEGPSANPKRSPRTTLRASRKIRQRTSWESSGPGPCRPGR